jgi:hypothetical protein
MNSAEPVYFPMHMVCSVILLYSDYIPLGEWLLRFSAVYSDRLILFLSTERHTPYQTVQNSPEEEEDDDEGVYP